MTKKDKIRLLIELSGKSKNALDGFKAKMNQFGMLNDQDKQTLADQFTKSSEEFYERQVDVYDRYLSEEAINASIGFYTSEAGKEINEKMLKIGDELTVVISDLMKDIFTKFTSIMESKDEFGDGEMFEEGAPGPWD